MSKFLIDYIKTKFLKCMMQLLAQLPALIKALNYKYFLDSFIQSHVAGPKIW